MARPDLEDTLGKIHEADLRGRRGLPYYAAPALRTAAAAAHALERPLLLTSDPGCGKTDFAWAIAGALGARKVHECYIHSEARARDLLYSYDSLARYRDVQLAALSDDARAHARSPANYVRLESLGAAIVDAAPGSPTVVLLDEIDKAPKDFPNDLLRELDHGTFEIPELPLDAAPHELPDGRSIARTVPVGIDRPGRPFVVITSNVERQLPEPFLRRCVFYHLEFPGEGTLRQIITDNIDHLRGRGELPRRAPAALDDPTRAAAVALFTRLRAFGGPSNRLDKPPATSELIDWIHALVVVDPPGLARLPDLARDPAPWGRLPALECLLKTREDRARVLGRT